MTVNPQALRVALEASLTANPDDVATYHAYADLLMEQGDPRGEFVQVQLALEDESLPAARRRKLATREKQLLKKHEREWLGPLAPYLIDNDTSHFEQEYYAEDQRFAHGWRRGFLARVEVHFFDRRLAHALLDMPGPCLLRELVVEDDAGFFGEAEPDPPKSRVKTPRGLRDHLSLFELLGSPVLRNLRSLQVGHESGGELGWTDCHVGAPGLEHVVAEMPRVEQLVLLCKAYSAKKLFGLNNLTNLRVLQVEHLEDYPLATFAKNPALGNLTHLWLHPHFWADYEDDEPGPDDVPGPNAGYLPLKSLAALLRSPHLKKLTHLRFRLSSAGDEGVALLIKHGWLRRLKLLDLRHGRVTDAGARLLADSPDLKHLDLLDLSRNQLTAEGVEVLRATGVNLRCDDQHPVGSTEYLTEGDFE
jgi:uncharacterized protein (TIGR02996 family)